MADASIIDRDNPWPGLASYDEAAQAWFSGRGAETAELARRIVDEPVTVLFGKSGLGKSSLLKAGVFPVLRQRGLLPVPVRLRFQGDAPDAIEQIFTALFAAFDAEQIEHPARTPGETLWDYLHREGLRFWTPKVRPVQPVLVLDQFEEVYTLGRSAPGMADALRERLADLAENRIPQALRERVDRGEALPAALDVHARPYKLVLSLREDFLPDLEGWVAAMPALRRNRMRLLPLRREQALQAVCNGRTEHLVDAALGRRIVEYLAGGGAASSADAPPAEDAPVEPALLSLVCRGINEDRKREGKPRFDDALFEKGKGRIVGDFYRDSLADQPDAARAFVEDELVTDQGYRNSYSVAQAVSGQGVTREQIATLVGRRLLRIEHHLGAERVELTHDLLTPPALAGRKARAEARWALRARQARRKWAGAVVGMAVLVAVLLLFLREAQNARFEATQRRIDAVELARVAVQAKTAAEAAQQGLAKSYVELANQKLEVEQSALRAEQAASAARAAEAKASEAENQARIDAGRARVASQIARSRELAARARDRMPKDRELAILLGIEALRAEDTPEARAVLLDGLRYAWPTATLDLAALGGTAESVAIDPTGRRVAVLARTEKAYALSAWDVETRSLRRLWPRPVVIERLAAFTFVPDGGRLLVAMADRIDLLAADGGAVLAPLALPPLAAPSPAVQLGVSGDGLVLVAAFEDGSLWVRALRDAGAAWKQLAPDGVSAFAVSADGRHIGTVSSDGLRPVVFDRGDDDAWAVRALALKADPVVQSVSPAPSYMVATWLAQSRTQSLEPGAKPEPAVTSRDGSAISDTIASAGGGAFVAVLGDRDLEVGLGNPSAPQGVSLVKGAGITAFGSMINDIGVDELGTRLVMRKDEGVQIVWLAGFKPMLADFEANSPVLRPAGSGVLVQARPTPAGASLVATESEMIPAAAGTKPLRWTADLPAMPSVLSAAGHHVFAQVGSRMFVHDLRSGRLAAGPLEGEATVLGDQGQFVLWKREIPGTRGGSRVSVVRSADGAVVRDWVLGGDDTVATSRRGNALFALQRLPGTDRMAAEAFVVTATGLESSGRLVDLPLSAAFYLRLEDDGRTFAETRAVAAAPAPAAASGSRPRRGELRPLLWRVSPGAPVSAADPALATSPPAAPPPARPGEVAKSASGRFAVRSEGTGSAPRTYTLWREGGSALPLGAGFLGHFDFSTDERWLAFMDGRALRVVDLTRWRQVLEWTDVDANGLSFVPGSPLLRIETGLRSGRGVVYAPVDAGLLERFARWLVPRELTRAERCANGLGDERCGLEERAAAGPPRAPR